MRNTTFALALLASLPVGLTLCGCGKGGHPSEEDGRKVYEYQLNHNFFALHKSHVLSFHQTNGQNAEVMGVKVYNMDFEAKVQPEPEANDKSTTGDGKTPAPETKKGTVMFEQTEKGWKGADGNVY